MEADGLGSRDHMNRHRRDPGSPRVPTRMTHMIDELKVGGAQTHLLTMIKQSALRYPEVEHRVLCLFGEGPFGERLRGAGVAVDVVDLRPLLARRRFLGAARVLEGRLREHRPDVVEAHLTWSRLLGLYAAWRVGVAQRIAFEPGDIYLNSWKFRIANHVGQLFADRVVVCSRALADWNRRTHGISPRRLTVLHNCVDLSRFSPREERDATAAFGLPPGATVFCAVGTLGSGVNKRTDVAIRAVAAARARGGDVALIICGDGDQRSELEALTDSLGAGPWVRFLGTRDDVPTVLDACDAFCHAAPFEPFGIVCIEAMASGLPVLVPDSGGIREVVEDGVTGLVYPALDHEALAAAMLRLHECPGLRRQLGQAARRAVEESFSVGPYLRTLYAMYGLEASR
ncbi:MAG: hypothetical protein JWN86_3629 [Planctomycetota bacterium]|nr:hypothetical protein [Planctomycetota bacterium]